MDRVNEHRYNGCRMAETSHMQKRARIDTYSIAGDIKLDDELDSVSPATKAHKLLLLFKCIAAGVSTEIVSVAELTAYAETAHNQLEWIEYFVRLLT